MKSLMFTSAAHTRKAVSSGLVVLVVALSTHTLSTHAIAQNAGKGAVLPRPEFRNEKAENAYDLGIEHYKNKQYDKAKVQFKKAEKGAKDKKSKSIVGKWALSTEAARSLAYLRKRVDSGKMVDSYFRAAGFLPTLVDTPIHDEFKQFVDDLAERTFHVIENFNRPTLSYSEKFGKKHTKDPKVVKFGAGCLHWAQTKNFQGFQLKLKGVPENLEAYAGIIFWMKVKRPTKMYVAVETRGEGKESFDALTGKKRVQQPAYRKEFTTPRSKKWEQVYLPFSSFEVFAEPEWKQATKLYVAVTQPKSKFDLYIDEIVLVRKDPNSRKPSRKKR